MTPAAAPGAVAVLGLGNLGAAIATRLRDRGFVVRGHDVSDDARERAARLGVEVADSSEEAARGATWVSLVVGTAEQVATCLEQVGPTADDAVVLVHATVDPAEVRALRRHLGPCLVDAPVSGGPDRARAGTLAVLAGGDPGTVERARPVLDALGRVHVTGDVGSAQVAKLVGQVVFMTTQGALLEGERLAAAEGVPWSAVRRALAGSTADCFALQEWGFFDEVASAYDAAGLEPAKRPWAKDLRTALAVAAEHDVDLPLTTTAAAVVPPVIDAHARRRRDPDGP